MRIGRHYVESKLPGRFLLRDNNEREPQANGANAAKDNGGLLRKDLRPRRVANRNDCRVF